MSNYTPDEVKMLIEMLKSNLPKKASSNVTKSPGNKPFLNKTERTMRSGNKPFLNKTERTMRYLEQRHKFFNPTKEMLQYIINIAENSDLDKAILEKMKEDILTKR